MFSLYIRCKLYISNKWRALRFYGRPRPHLFFSALITGLPPAATAQFKIEEYILHSRNWSHFINIIIFSNFMSRLNLSWRLQVWVLGSAKACPMLPWGKSTATSWRLPLLCNFSGVRLTVFIVFYLNISILNNYPNCNRLSWKSVKTELYRLAINSWSS